MTFTKAISTCMGKYATFSGRAKRSEFWWFYLFTVLLSWGASLVEAATIQGDMEGVQIISSIVSLAFLLPTLAAGSRRLHDIGRTSWWLLLILTGIGIILLIVWWATDSKKEDNKFGSYTSSHIGEATAEADAEL